MRSLIIDTGSSVSILQPRVSNRKVKVTSMKPYGVTGEALDVKGRQFVSFELGGRVYKHTFLVCPLPTETAGLLGTDFMEEAGAVIDFKGSKMSFSDTGKASRAHSDPSTERTALTIFLRGKDGHSPQLEKKVAWQTDEQLPASPHREKIAPQNRIWLVKAKENITLPPRCSKIVAEKLEIGKKQTLPPLVCMEPAQIHVEGIFPARTPTRFGTSAHPTFQVTSQRGHAVSELSNCAYVMLANFSEVELIVPKATKLGVAEEVSELLVDKINMDSTIRPPRKNKNMRL